MVSIDSVKVDIPEGMNVIIGQSHFIKTVPDLYEILVASSPHVKFGVAFSEASGHCLVRHEGNDPDLEKGRSIRQALLRAATYSSSS